MATDKYANTPEKIDSPADEAFSITPHNTNEITKVTRGLYVGADGDIAVTMKSGDEVTFVGAKGGSVLPIRVKIVKSTGTTATDLIGLV